MFDFALKLSAAYVLDLAFGDPQWFPHPVRWIGSLIGKGERFLRAFIRSELAAGAVLSLGIIALSFFGTQWLLRSLTVFSAPLSTALEILILYWCLATKDLAVESRRVKKALQAGEIGLARKKLAWIVGRDTDKLNEEEILRATVETVAENTVDGVIAPLFYAVLGGAPLAMAYKTINTLDSMIGHKDERYIRFGKAAAQFDTWANWIPARIAGFIFPLTAAILRFSPGNSFSAAWTHVSNSGIPEGAMAGALQIQLGGTNYYKGKTVETPRMGSPIRQISIENIDESIKMMYFSSLLFLIACLFVLMVLK